MCKLDNVSLITRTPIKVERENWWHKAVLWLSYVSHGMCVSVHMCIVHTHILTIIIKWKKLSFSRCSHKFPILIEHFKTESQHLKTLSHIYRKQFFAVQISFLISMEKMTWLTVSADLGLPAGTVFLTTLLIDGLNNKNLHLFWDIWLSCIKMCHCDQFNKKAKPPIARQRE